MPPPITATRRLMPVLENGRGESLARFAPRPLPSIEESESPGFDAFARLRVRRRARIVERAVRGEARGHAGVGIEDLEHEGFVARHLREVVPHVRRIVGDVVDLAGAIFVTPLDLDEA